MQPRKIEKYTVLLGLVIFFTGCTNALYFYETEKISLTVEARPDSTQPVQGSLGLKQRVALIAPKKNKNDDALSAISSFNFKIIPIDWEFNPVLIQTAFITGDAAAGLNQNEAANAAQAITFKVPEIKGIDKIASDILTGVKDENNRTTLKQILTARDFNHLTDEDYDQISQIINYDRQSYYERLHEELRKQLSQ